MAQETLFPRPVSRVIAATVGVLVTALIVTTAMPAYLPVSQASSIVVPIVLFPVTWLAMFLWVLFEPRMWRAWLGLVLLSGVHLSLILAGVGVL